MNLRIQTVILLGMIALILPWLISDFRVFQVNLMLVYAIAVLGLNLLTGYGGQISLGHGAFYAIGAYTAAILMDQAQWSAYATLPVAALVCLAAGHLNGLPCPSLGRPLFGACDLCFGDGDTTALEIQRH